MADKAKPRIVRDNTTGAWSILDVQPDGSTVVRKGDKGNIPAIPNMSEHESILMFLDLADKASTKRNAAVSLLARILKEQMGRVEAWRGKGNPTAGIDNELKGAFQKCEDKYFEKFLSKDHPDHELFVGRLPKLDLQGKPLEIDGKLEAVKQFEAFLTATRRDPSYANNKNTVLGYFNLCGKLPYDEDGTIVPPEVMAQEVANARIVTPADNSLRKRLMDLRTELMDEKKAPPGDDLPAILRTLAEMTEYAQQLENIHAARLTARGGARVGDSVKDKADAEIKRMQEGSSLVPSLPAPEKPEVKAPETAAT